MGYGTRALNLLKDYYELKITSLDESELPSEHIDSVQDEDVGLLEETIGNILNTHGWFQTLLTNNVYIIHANLIKFLIFISYTYFQKLNFELIEFSWRLPNFTT